MSEPRGEEAGRCRCFVVPYEHLSVYQELGMDENWAEVSVLLCQTCGQYWLRYFYEHEAFTGSGRWYLGAITPRQLSVLTVANAKRTLEGLSWYSYGGSFFGRGGTTSGTIRLFP